MSGRWPGPLKWQDMTTSPSHDFISWVVEVTFLSLSFHLSSLLSIVRNLIGRFLRVLITWSPSPVTPSGRSNTTVQLSTSCTDACFGFLLPVMWLAPSLVPVVVRSFDCASMHVLPSGGPDMSIAFANNSRSNSSRSWSVGILPSADVVGLSPVIRGDSEDNPAKIIFIIYRNIWRIIICNFLHKTKTLSVNYQYIYFNEQWFKKRYLSF